LDRGEKERWSRLTTVPLQIFRLTRVIASADTAAGRATPAGLLLASPSPKLQTASRLPARWNRLSGMAWRWRWILT